MATVEIALGKELGRFESRAQWINHAERTYSQVYQQIGSKDVITLDSATPRRVMQRGFQFNRAHDEFTYPAVIYAIGE